MMPNVLQKVAEQYEDGIDVYRGYCLVWNEILNTKRNCIQMNASVCHRLVQSFAMSLLLFQGNAIKE